MQKNESMMKKDVLIAGAGIGGLATAIALTQSGHKVKIFEQAPELGEIGAGIQLAPNATKVLGELGVSEAAVALGVTPERSEIRMFDTGEVILDLPHGKVLEETLGAPYIQIHRADIHGVLADRLMELAPESLVLNATAQGFIEDDNGVTLLLSDGREFTGDLLVGADGIKSVVRHQIHGEEEPNWTGNIAWRAVVPVDKLPKDFMGATDTIACAYMGPGKHMPMYYLRNKELVNMVAVVECEPEWRTESWTAKAPWEELKADFAGWHDTVQQLIDAVDKDECYRWALYNRLPIDNWSTARATLLGDAAHATLPFLASGAAMALEDAWVLKRSLDQQSNVADAFQLYQRNRLERTARIQNHSTENGHRFHARTAEAIKKGIVEALQSQSQGQFMGWLYSYDPLTVELV